MNIPTKELVLALIGLGAAYWAWTYQEKENADAVEIAQCNPSDFKSLSLDTTNRKTTLVKDNDIYWLDLINKSSGKEKSDTQTLRYPAKEDVEKTFLNEELDPLYAIRSLGELKKEGRKTLGLYKSKDAITIDCGKKTKFTLGKSNYGAGERAAWKGKGAVYILGAEFLRQLESAESQLVQREFQTWKEEDETRIEVLSGGKKEVFLHLNRLDKNKSAWAKSTSPTKRNEEFQKWLSALRRLSLSKFLEQNELPGQKLEKRAGDPEEVLKLRFIGKDENNLGNLELMRVAIEGGSFEYFAKSDATRIWAIVPNRVGQQLAEDLTAIVSE